MNETTTQWNVENRHLTVEIECGSFVLRIGNKFHADNKWWNNWIWMKCSKWWKILDLDEMY